jgi:hypothetical protein
MMFEPQTLISFTCVMQVAGVCLVFIGITFGVLFICIFVANRAAATSVPEQSPNGGGSTMQDREGGGMLQASHTPIQAHTHMCIMHLRLRSF